ncbi:bacteriohemerythrin [Azospirillum sp. sgz301742]
MSETFTWSPAMSVGRDQLDRDHKGIIKALNELSALKGSDDGDKVQPVLNRLLKYTVSHFGREESYMRDIGYSKIAEHEQKHDLFIQKVQFFVTEYREGRRSMLAGEMAEFLRIWLFEHIMSEDMAYAAEAVSHGPADK